jgi:hypothetical protein
MNKLLLCLFLLFFATNTNSFSQTDANIDIVLKNKKIKRHSVGLGVSNIVSFSGYIYHKTVSNIKTTNYTNLNKEQYFLGTNNFMIFTIHHKFYIKNRLNYSNFLRIDYAGGNRNSPFFGVNFYPSINYNFHNKNINVGIGSSIIIGKYNVRRWITNEVIETKKVIVAFPLLYCDYRILREKRSSLSLFTYIGYSQLENSLLKANRSLKNPSNRNYILQNTGYGRNFTYRNIFFNLLGIKYEINL